MRTLAVVVTAGGTAALGLAATGVASAATARPYTVQVQQPNGPNANNTNSQPFTLQLGTFVGSATDCGAGHPAGTASAVVSQWDLTTGNPAPSIFLQKNEPTADCSAAGVDIITPLVGQPVSKLTELNQAEFVEFM
jgi:hypothetical protein